MFVELVNVIATIINKNEQMNSTISAEIFTMISVFKFFFSLFILPPPPPLENPLHL